MLCIWFPKKLPQLILSIILSYYGIKFNSSGCSNEEYHPTKVEKSGEEELFRRMPSNKNGEAGCVAMIFLEDLVNSLGTICNIQNTIPFENPC